MPQKQENAQINSPYEFFYLLHQKPLQPHSSKVEVVAVSLLLQGILFHTHHPGRTINGDIIMIDMHFYLEKDFSNGLVNIVKERQFLTFLIIRNCASLPRMTNRAACGSKSISIALASASPHPTPRSGGRLLVREQKRAGYLGLKEENAPLCNRQQYRVDKRTDSTTMTVSLIFYFLSPAGFQIIL